jgi:DNA-binding NarL/FixJ family response regulator
MKISILLADDHAIVREGLKVLLEILPFFTVVGEAATGREVLLKARQTRPDIVVMDIAMPGLNGIEATAQLQAECPAAKVVILSVYSTTEHIYRAFRAGASGYVLKESAGKELVEAIRTVHNNRPYLSRKILEMYPDLPEDLKRDHSPLQRLSGREKEILQLVVEGKTSVKIAEILAISPKTVETYRSRLMQKLEINDLASLVKFAIQNGITPIS